MYDFYEITSLVFTGNCLNTIDSSSFCYAKKLKKLVIPSSVTKISQDVLGGMESVTDLYYCSLVKPNKNIFSSADNTPKTNSNLRIHVTESYDSQNFGSRNIYDRNTGDYCVDETKICSFINNTCEKKRYIITNVFMFIILHATEINEYTNTRK